MPRRLLPIALAILAILGALAAYHYVDVAAVVARLRGAGSVWWAPLAYIAAYAVLDVLLIPTQALSIAAVLMWGWWIGGLVELLAATIGAVFPYLITRTASHSWIEAKVQRYARVRELLAREGFSLLLVLRLVPIVPYTLLNYVAGFSAVRLLPYIVATLLGMIPSVFIFNYFVDAVLQGVMQPREVMFRVLGAGALLAALVIGTRLAMRKVGKRIA